MVGLQSARRFPSRKVTTLLVLLNCKNTEFTQRDVIFSTHKLSLDEYTHQLVELTSANKLNCNQQNEFE